MIGKNFFDIRNGIIEERREVHIHKLILFDFDLKRALQQAEAELDGLVTAEKPNPKEVEAKQKELKQLIEVELNGADGNGG